MSLGSGSYTRTTLANDEPVPRVSTSKEWKAGDVSVSLTGSYVYFTLRCGETRYMSVMEAKALAKKITELAQVWARS
jgi:hypothetical protein